MKLTLRGVYLLRGRIIAASEDVRKTNMNMKYIVVLYCIVLAFQKTSGGRIYSQLEGRTSYSWYHNPGVMPEQRSG